MNYTFSSSTFTDHFTTDHLKYNVICLYALKYMRYKPYSNLFLCFSYNSSLSMYHWPLKRRLQSHNISTWILYFSWFQLYIISPVFIYKYSINNMYSTVNSIIFHIPLHLHFMPFSTSIITIRETIVFNIVNLNVTLYIKWKLI